MCNILDISRFQLFSPSNEVHAQLLGDIIAYTGAAFGPLIVGWLTDQYVSHLYIHTYMYGIWLVPSYTTAIVIHHMQDWTSAFYLLMGCCFLSAMVSILFQAGMASSFKR